MKRKYRVHIEPASEYMEFEVFASSVEEAKKQALAQVEERPLLDIDIWDPTRREWIRV